MNLFIWKWLKSKTFHLNKKMVKNLVMNSIFPSIFNIFIIWKWRKRPGCSYTTSSSNLCLSRFVHPDLGIGGAESSTQDFMPLKNTTLGLLRLLLVGPPQPARQSWAQAFGGGCGFSPATARSWGEDHALLYVTLAGQKGSVRIKMRFLKISMIHWFVLLKWWGTWWKEFTYYRRWMDVRIPAWNGVMENFYGPFFFGRKLAGGQVEMFTARAGFTPDNQQKSQSCWKMLCLLGGSYM